ncbi:MAG TPA: hypothetical protein PK689_05775, partial [Kiritimatiellia bacterium]|nr:hypothetical protein [Kiritimatiellia bacterium]
MNLGRAELGQMPIGSDAPEAQELGGAPALHGAAEALNQIPTAVPRGGKALLAAWADLEGLALKVPPENLEQFAQDPTAPLPIEKAKQELPPGAGRLAAGAAMGGIKVVPALGAATVGTALTGSAVLGSGLPFLVNENGELDPIGAAIAAGIPVVDAATRQFLRTALFQSTSRYLNPAELRALWQKVADGTATDQEARLVQLINSHLSNKGASSTLKAARQHGVDIITPGRLPPSVQAAAEVVGGQAAVNAYLLGASLPQILQSQNPEEAFLDQLAAQIGMGMLAAPGMMREVRAAPERAPGAERVVPRSGPAETAPEPRPAEEGAEIPPDIPGQPKFLPGRGPGASPETPAPRPPSPPPTEPSPRNPAPSSPTGDKPPPTAETGEGTTGEGETITAPSHEAVLGREVKVKGSKNQVLTARYAWVPFPVLQASHAGSLFSLNPLYDPLVNTRDYERDKAEQEKVVAGANNFDPADYVVHTQSPALGPLVVAAGSDAVVRVLGGNGRKQMLDRLTPEQWNELGALQDAEAAVFGLPARPTNRHVLVRLLPALNLETPEGVLAARQLVDALNPSPGLHESTQKLAENDALNVPVEALLRITPQSSTGLMREWMQRLLADGLVDRNTRARVLNSDEEVRDYVSRLVIHAAYRDNVVSRIRN